MTAPAPQLPQLLQQGKVRDVYDIGYSLLAMVATDRCSSFDKYICDIPRKGLYINKMSEWWFQQTTAIIPNHMVYSAGDTMIVKHCQPFKIEVVVRGYITGSTKTSLWTVYNSGQRNYCGHTFPDGLIKNQQLARNVVTPTTKGTTDVPVSASEIIEMGLATAAEWEYIEGKALELFQYGQQTAAARGLILVDTKYEFGKDANGQILLIDELHTCDSSRYWVAASYAVLHRAGEEPTKVDKDAVRDYVRKVCTDPYTDPIPNIPTDVRERVSTVYEQVTRQLTGAPSVTKTQETQPLECLVTTYFKNRISDMVVVIAGSISDQPAINNLSQELSGIGIFHQCFYASAHKQPREVLEILAKYERGSRIVYITCAGMSNALSGFVAANSKFPVIAHPLFKDKLDCMLNVQSTLQMPSNVPSMTVLSHKNAALAAARILRF